MKLVFHGQGKYADLSKGYELYLRRTKKENPLDDKTYSRVVKAYCNGLASRLCKDGIVDLPNDMGSIAAVIIKRKPQYRGKKFVGYGKYDPKTGTFDGTMKAFGMMFLPKHGENDNLRCYGYVANRRLFQKMKQLWESREAEWSPIYFNDEMI